MKDDELALLQNAEFKQAFDEFDQVTYIQLWEALEEAQM